MRPHGFALLAGGLAAVALALLILTPGRPPAPAPPPPTRTLTVPGQAEVRVPATGALITLRPAATSPALDLDRLAAALAGAGVAAEDVHAAPPGAGGAYAQVVVRNLKAIGRVLDAAGRAGAQVAAVTYTATGAEEARQGALRAAMENAEERARELAAAAGGSVRELLRAEAQVEEEQGPGEVVIRARVTATFQM